MSTKPVRSDLKILLIGASGTGKTSFVARWCKGEFKEDYKPTIVSEFGFKIYSNKNNLYRIQLWDIGGQDKSPSMARIFSRDSHGCVVLSDVKNQSSIEEVLSWKKVVEDASNFIDGEKLPFVLVMNKIDLVQDNEEMQNLENKASQICEENNFLKSYMASVKENKNVNETMDFLIEKIIERLEKYASEGHDDVFNDITSIRTSLKLKNGSRELRQENKGCC